MQACGAMYAHTPAAAKFIDTVLASKRDDVIAELVRIFFDLWGNELSETSGNPSVIGLEKFRGDRSAHRCIGPYASDRLVPPRP